MPYMPPDKYFVRENPIILNIDFPVSSYYKQNREAAKKIQHKHNENLSIAF